MDMGLKEEGSNLYFPQEEIQSECQSHYYGLITFILEACLYSPGFPEPTSMHLLAHACTEEKDSKWQLTTTNNSSFKRTAKRNRQPCVCVQHKAIPH